MTGCLGTRSDDFPASSFTAHAAAAAEAAQVVRVIDGDTYILLSGSGTCRLRLLGVDAPEQDQAFGPQATDSVARLLASERVVLVARAGLDLYGRTLGAVLLPTSTVAAAGRTVPLNLLLMVRGSGPGPSTRTEQWPGGRSSRWPRSGPGVGYGNAARPERYRRSCGGPSIQKSSGAIGLAAPGNDAA